MCLHANNKLTLEVLHMSACILGTHTGCFTYVCMHTTNTHWQFYMCLHTTNTLEVLHVSACIHVHAYGCMHIDKLYSWYKEGKAQSGQILV